MTDVLDDAIVIREQVAWSEVLKMQPELAGREDVIIARHRNSREHVRAAPHAGCATKVKLWLNASEPQILIQMGRKGVLTLWLHSADMNSDGRSIRISSADFNINAVLDLEGE